ncbi:MAG: glycosyltransferase family 2 protein [Rhodospirillaceae bacterium]
MPPLRLSAVIPVYNRAAVIGRALASIRRQTCQPDEVIVVDDGSTDDLEAALQPFTDLPLRLIRQTNGGAAAARNTGMACASGDTVAFLDSDDIWLPEKTARQLAWLERAPPGVLAVTTGFAMAEEGRWIEGAAFDDIRIPSDRNRPTDHLWICDVSPGTTLMLRRSTWDLVGPLDTGFQRLEDWDWLIRLGRQGSLGVVPDVLAVVFRSTPPGINAVRTAGAMMWKRHAVALDHAGRRRLRAALDLENAAALRSAGQSVPATAALLRATLGWPGRLLPLLLRRIVGRLGLIVTNSFRVWVFRLTGRGRDTN